MEQTVTLMKVNDAIENLRQRGERISRRNVQSLIGGGMSTVHKLMSRIEDNEAILLGVPAGISSTLQTAIRTEIGEQIQQATKVLSEQIQLLQRRESEALEALAEMEIKAETLSVDLRDLRGEYALERNKAEKNQAVSNETINRLETVASGFEKERLTLNEAAASAKIDAAKAQLLADLANQDSEKTAASLELKKAELVKVRRFLVDADKKTAIAWQKVKDLREALTKAEGRSRRTKG